jgi:hypothetical protein
VQVEVVVELVILDQKELQVLEVQVAEAMVQTTVRDSKEPPILAVVVEGQIKMEQVQTVVLEVVAVLAQSEGQAPDPLVVQVVQEDPQQ